MSKIKLLLDVVADLKALEDSLQVVADAVASNEPEETSQPLESKAEKTSKEKEITLEEVRALLAEKSHDGFTAEVRGLLEKHGGSKLSEIDPKKYHALLKDAEELK